MILGHGKNVIYGMIILDRTKKGNRDGITISRHRYIAFFATWDVSFANRHKIMAKTGNI